MQEEKTCEGCGAKCCREANVWLEEPKTDKDFDEWKWLLSHKNLYIYKDPRYGWMICFETECKFLDKESKCTNYEKRPALCKEYGLKDCIRYDNLKVEPILRNPEDIEELKKEFAEKVRRKQARESAPPLKITARGNSSSPQKCSIACPQNSQY